MKKKVFVTGGAGYVGSRLIEYLIEDYDVTVYDTLYFGKDHFRNYIDIDNLNDILNKNNFKILYIKEGKDMAKYKNENNICIRVICKKL